MRFNVPITPTAVSAGVDLWEFVSSATRPTVIEELYIDQKTLTSGRLGVQLILSNTTTGSGGSTSAALPINNATGTYGGTTPKILNTTVASAGSPVLQKPWVWNLVAGLLWLPVPEHRFSIPVSTRCVIRLIDAPASAMTVSGNVVIDE